MYSQSQSEPCFISSYRVYLICSHGLLDRDRCVLDCENAEDVLLQWGESMSYVEQLLTDQLVAAIGKDGVPLNFAVTYGIVESA